MSDQDKKAPEAGISVRLIRMFDADADRAESLKHQKSIHEALEEIERRALAATFHLMPFDSRIH